MRVFWPLLILAFSATPAGAADWKTFRNDRFGFAVDIPSAFKPSPPPENGDGLQFTSPDGASTVAAYGHLLVDVASLAEDERQEEGFATKDGVRITYRQVSSGSATFSGTKGERILYQRAVSTCKGTAAAILRADYSASRKAIFDPLIAHMARTLKGSNNCWSPG